jgi:hypothetical protein
MLVIVSLGHDPLLFWGAKEETGQRRALFTGSGNKFVEGAFAVPVPRPAFG